MADDVRPKALLHLLLHAVELHRVRDRHRDHGHRDRQGGGVVRLVAREAQVVRVHVRRVIRGDRVARHHVLQDARLVEQLERADDREDHRDRERALQFGQLDGLDDLPFARAVNAGGLVQRVRDRGQRAVEGSACCSP